MSQKNIKERANNTLRSISITTTAAKLNPKNTWSRSPTSNRSVKHTDTQDITFETSTPVNSPKILFTDTVVTVTDNKQLNTLRSTGGKTRVETLQRILNKVG